MDKLLLNLKVLTLGHRSRPCAPEVRGAAMQGYTCVALGKARGRNSTGRGDTPSLRFTDCRRFITALCFSSTFFSRAVILSIIMVPVVSLVVSASNSASLTNLGMVKLYGIPTTTLHAPFMSISVTFSQRSLWRVSYVLFSDILPLSSCRKKAWTGEFYNS